MVILLASYYYKPHFGGVENSLYSLAKAAAKDYGKVRILVSDAAIDKNKRLPAYEIIDEIEVFRFRHFIPVIGLLYIFAPLYDMLSCYKLFKKMRKNSDFKKVIVRHHIPAMALLLATKTKVSYIVPGVVRFQDTMLLHKRKKQALLQKLKNWYAYVILISQQVWIQNYVFKKSKTLFVFSETMRQQIIKSAGRQSLDKKIRQVYPGVDMDRFNRLNKAQARLERGIPPSAFVFLCIGRMTLHKGFDQAIDAFQALVKKYPDDPLQLMLVGDGPESKILQQKAAQVSLAGQVKFIGKTTEPELYYTLSDVFVMSSIHETFGQTIIEAMAAGLPVVGFKSGGRINTATSDIVTHTVHGLLCEDSIADLTRVMEEIYQMTFQKRQEMKQHNQELVANRYSWKTLIESV